MALFFTFFLILVLLIIGMIFYVSSGDISSTSADFLVRGREAGLSPSEIKILKRTADFLKMEKPMTILGSLDHVDKAIRKISNILEASDYRNHEAVEILDDLFQFKKKIELKKKERKNIIISSREIDEGQEVKITLAPNHPPLSGVVISNTPGSLVVDLSKESGINSVALVPGVVNLYFWKKDDAGYYFETSVLDSALGSKWKLSHSTNLIRSQKRNSIRKDLNISGYIVKLENISKKNNSPIGENGTIIKIKNLSESGMAFVISGKVPSATALKSEFYLSGRRVVVSGTVRESIFDESRGISLVRLIFSQPEISALTYLREFLYTSNINEIPKSVENPEELYQNVDKDEEEPEGISEVEYLPEDNEVLI